MRTALRNCLCCAGVALAAAGCGSANRTQAHSATRYRQTPISTARLRPTAGIVWTRFVYLANSLCQTTAGAGRGPVPPATARATVLKAFARNALSPIEQRSVILQRLGRESGHLRKIRPLMADYESLMSAYRRTIAAISPAATVSAARATAAAQQRVIAEASALHTPLCAPHAVGR